MGYTDRTGVVGRYLAILFIATASGACATTGAVPVPFPGAQAPAASRPAERSESPEDLGPLIATALELRGVPYRNGGSDISGFDCSGFVQYVFAQHGRSLPREVQEQFEVGQDIAPKDVRAGDLVFFHTDRRGASHVGIALDEERFVHAPSSRGVVRIERYTNEYWSKRYVGARRFDWRTSYAGGSVTADGA